MNALLRVVVLSSAAAGPRQVRVVNDDACIAYVERVARRRGVLVQWVNPPTRRIVAGRQ